MKAIRTTRHEVAGDLLMAQTAPACYNSRPPKQFTANGGTMSPLRNFALVATLGFSSLAAQTGPPPTPVPDVSDTYFGTTVIDHYRYLEELKNPEVVTWFKAQNDYTRGVLASIPGREQLYNRVRQLDTTSISVNAIQVDGGRYFYLKTLPDANNRR